MKNSYMLVEDVARAKGMTMYRISQEAGIPDTSLYRWKNKGIVPKWEKMSKVAAVLGITTESIYEADM